MSEIQLFLVRVWRERRQFRAAVRGAGADEPRFFTAPEQVGEYLHRATAADEPACERATAVASTDPGAAGRRRTSE